MSWRGQQFDNSPLMIHHPCFHGRHLGTENPIFPTTERFKGMDSMSDISPKEAHWKSLDVRIFEGFDGIVDAIEIPIHRGAFSRYSQKAAGQRL